MTGHNRGWAMYRCPSRFGNFRYSIAGRGREKKNLVSESVTRSTTAMVPVLAFLLLDRSAGACDERLVYSVFTLLWPSADMQHVTVLLGNQHSSLLGLVWFVLVMSSTTAIRLMLSPTMPSPKKACMINITARRDLDPKRGSRWPVTAYSARRPRRLTNARAR